MSALLLVALLTCGFAAAEEAVKKEALPSGEQVLDWVVEAAGGIEAAEKIKNRMSKGEIEFVGMGLKAPVTVYEAAPRNSYLLLESDAIGAVEEGTNGEIAWENSAIQGPRIKEGAEARRAVRESTFNRDFHWRDHYASAVTEAAEAVEEQMCWRVLVTPKEGRAETWWVEQKSRLVVKRSGTMDHVMGEIKFSAYQGDYREIDGLKIPFLVRTEVLQQQQKITLESVQHNVEIPEGTFDLPEEIQALATKAAE
ncbi:MAG: outer membrane lipoprotein-sorting protein [bacterium]|nr:outer membrane lipoprotein-sorting protein [bacterium]